MIKKYIYTMMIMAASTILWGCHDEEEVVHVPVEDPEWKLDMLEEIPDPAPTWQMPGGGIYPFSMTAIIRLSDFLEQYADDADEISAFIGQECRGIVKSQEYHGKHLFFLYLRGNSTESEKVTLKYYNHTNKKLYVCQDLFDFVQNGVYGTIGEPSEPPFEESGKYPDEMEAVVSLPEQLPFVPNNQDRLAAFIGDECRGVAELMDEEGMRRYRISIRGKKQEKTAIHFRYYSVAAKGIFLAHETIAFKDGGVEGTEEVPLELNLELELSN